MSRSKSAPQSVRVRVPATTANLGPGYDSLGMALDLFNDFTVVRKANGPNRIVGRGTCAHIRGARNVFFRAFRRVCKLAGKPAPKVDVEIEGRVPTARGLGSSATAIVAGAMTANALLGSPFSKDELLLSVVREEGHPDNVAPALLGSLAASVWQGDNVLVHLYRPHAKWRLALLVPDYELSTRAAREAIPAKIPHKDAVFNLTRAPLLIDAIETGDAGELGLLLEDRLHEPYRKHLIKGYDAIRRAALEAGAAGVYLSGAGPTMAAFCDNGSRAKKVGEAMLKTVEGETFASEALILKPVSSGAEVVEV